MVITFLNRLKISLSPDGKGLKKVISNPTKRGTFDTFLSKPYFGNYKLEIQALIKYKMSVKNGHKKYNKYSPVTQLNMTLES